MTNFYTKNDWETVMGWAISDLEDNHDIVNKAINSSDALSILYNNFHNNTIPDSTISDKHAWLQVLTTNEQCAYIWGPHGNKHSLHEQICPRAFEVFHLIHRLVMEFGEQMDLYRLGCSDYVCRFYTEQLVLCVFEDLCDKDCAGLKEILTEDSEKKEEAPPTKSNTGCETDNTVGSNPLFRR